MTSQIVSRSSFPVAGLVLATIAGAVLYRLDILPDTPTLTAVASFALLVFGLPHGTFDLALLRRAGAGGTLGSGLAMVLLYLGCAAIMYLAWRIGPVLALAAFLVMAVVHFAEDWADCGSPFLACGIAVGIVSAPALLHIDSLRQLFVALTGDAGAAVLADLLLLVAPVGIAVALVGLGVLWQAARPALALSGGCALAAVLLLPPVPGFALFFCLVHSPIQFRAHADSLGLRGIRQWGGIVVPLTLGGFGIAAAIFLLDRGQSIPASVFASSFMTLSILTVPHMLVPMIASRIGRLRRRFETA